MKLDLPRISVTEFALRVIASGGARQWFTLVGDSRSMAHLAEGVRVEMESLGNGSIEVVSAPQDAAALAHRVRTARSDAVLLVFGLDAFDESDWKRLDLLRSRLVRQHAVALVLTEGAFGRFNRSAPNLASWIGGAVWSVDSTNDDLTPDERNGRLSSLREWAGLSDAEIVRRAQNGTLPAEPEYVEWLVLLGREDLIGH